MSEEKEQKKKMSLFKKICIILFCIFFVLPITVNILFPEEMEKFRKEQEAERVLEAKRAAEQAQVEKQKEAEEKKKNQKWYEGGTLHQASALDWQKADAANKLATCADLVATMVNRKMLKDEFISRIKSPEHLKPLAIELVKALDAAFKADADPNKNEKLYANQIVSQTTVILATMMKWLKK